MHYVRNRRKLLFDIIGVVVDLCIGYGYGCYKIHDVRPSCFFVFVFFVFILIKAK